MVKKITHIALSLFLGGMMIYGGIEKFLKPTITPHELVEKAQKFLQPDQQETLQKILYISGMKQTGYFWPLLGICELLFGLLIIYPKTRFVGSLLLLPITLHIFLFHLFLESDEIGELLMTFMLFAVNIYFVAIQYPKWKHLVWDTSEGFKF